MARWWIVLAVTVIGGLAALGLGLPAASWPDRGRLRALVIGVGALGLAGALLRFEVQVVGASGRSYAAALSLWGDALQSTRAGKLDAARIVAAAVMVIGGYGWRRRWGGSIAALGALASVGVNAVEGHAWSASARWVATVADVVHQLAACAWVGGLVGIVFAGASSRGALASRFSRVAGAALGAVLLTGVVATVVQFGTSPDGLRVAYGRVLGVKVLLVVAMALLGRRSRGLLSRPAARGEALQRTVAVEACFAVGVFALTAALVGMVPARALVGSGAFNGTADDGRGSVSVTVDPAGVGENAMHLYFFDTQQRPRSIDAVEVRVSTGDVPPRVIDVEPVTQGHFVAPSFSLPAKGLWTFSVVSVTRGEVAKFSIEVKVS